MKAEFKPLKFRRFASDCQTELADTNDLEWTPMEVDPYFGEPMLIMKEIIAAIVLDALLKMREPRHEPPR
jgi:hypothetical protein